MPNRRVKIGNPVSNLNIVLSKDQINDIVRSVIGPKGGLIDPKALASDYCCVDAAVGSSVAGPVSSVASSVSVPNPEGKLNVGNKMENLKHDLHHKLDANEVKVNIATPTNVKVR
jgi:hypothetical protein